MDKHSGKDNNKKIHCFALILCLLGGNLLLNRFPAWQVLFSSRIPFGVLNFVDDNNKKKRPTHLCEIDVCRPGVAPSATRKKKIFFFFFSVRPNVVFLYYFCS